jgi:hypothetical protein
MHIKGGLLGEEREKRQSHGLNTMELHYMQVSKYHNETLLEKGGGEDEGELRKSNRGMNVIKVHFYACMEISQ